MSWSLDESRSAEPYTPPPKPHIGIETPVVNSKPHPTLTNSDIKIMIAKDVASQHTKLALHTIRTNAKETKGGEACFTEMSLTQPETKTNGMQRAN